MKVKVKFLANTALLMKRKEIQIELPPEKIYTIKDIIKKISGLTKINIKNAIFNKKEKSTDKILITINGRDITFLSAFKTVINDGDIITISPLTLLG